MGHITQNSMIKEDGKVLPRLLPRNHINFRSLETNSSHETNKYMRLDLHKFRVHETNKSALLSSTIRLVIHIYRGAKTI